jgi:hypothetical protein
LEAEAYAVKDALLCIDDYAPYGSTRAVQEMESKTERVLRAQGNNSGRQRQNADLSLRPAMPPSGLILGTGEDAPRGQSIHARILTLSLAPGDVDLGLLTQYQALARQGVFAQSMAGFLRWMAPQQEKLAQGLKQSVSEWRSHFLRPSQHARAAYNAAHLMYGWSLLLKFASEIGALNEHKRQRRTEQGIEAILKATMLHTQDQDVTDPAIRFLDILRSSLATGKAYLADAFGGEPEEPRAWGWRLRDPGHEGKFIEWQPQGRKVGWVVEDDVFLDLVAALAVVMAHRDGNELQLSNRTLSKRLHEKDLLASTEPKRETLLVRRTLEGRRQEVLHLKASLLGAGKPDQPDHDSLTPLSPLALQGNHGSAEPIENQQRLFLQPERRSSKGYGFH